MTQMIAQVQHLTVKKEQICILNNLSFDILSNEILIILGPNGAGKSTLLKALAGLVKYSGSIEWQTQKISYVPPQESFNKQHMPPMTVQEFFAFKHNIPHAIIRENLTALGLPETFLDKSLLHLSTGEFQRMLLAWSLVDNPKVLLLDEPSSGMDIAGEESLYEHLHELWHERKITIVLVTHNLNIVWKHAHRVLCMDKKLICIGEPQSELTPKTLELMYGKGKWLYEHRHSRSL